MMAAHHKKALSLDLLFNIPSLLALLPSYFFAIIPLMQSESKKKLDNF